MLLSIVIPVYGAPNILPALYERLVEALSSWTDFELIMVNDCCPQGSGKILAEMAAKDGRVKFIDLIRNYGQHVAITAGLDYARGDYAVVMDCDLQDQPEQIRKMYDYLLAGSYEAVFGIRGGRKHSQMQKFQTGLFRFFHKRLAQGILTTNEDIGNFSIITSRVVRAYRLFREDERLYGVIISRILPKIGYLEVSHGYRHEGKSSYDLKKRLRLAFNVIISNSSKPLSFAIYGSFGSFALAGVIGLNTLFKYFVHGVSISGWTSLMLVLCFFSGLQMLFLGILGAYLGSANTSLKHRPMYIIRHGINIADPPDIDFDALRSLLLDKVEK